MPSNYEASFKIMNPTLDEKSSIRDKKVILPISFERETTTVMRTGSHLGDKFFATLYSLKTHKPKKVRIVLAGGLQIENDIVIYELEYKQKPSIEYIAKRENFWKEEEKKWFKKQKKYISQELCAKGIEVTVETWNGEILFPENELKIAEKNDLDIQEYYKKNENFKKTVDEIAEKTSLQILSELKIDTMNKELKSLAKQGSINFLLGDSKKIIPWIRDGYYDGMLYPGMEKMEPLNAAILKTEGKDRFYIVDIKHTKLDKKIRVTDNINKTDYNLPFFKMDKEKTSNERISPTSTSDSSSDEEQKIECMKTHLTKLEEYKKISTPEQFKKITDVFNSVIDIFDMSNSPSNSNIKNK